MNDIQSTQLTTTDIRFLVALNASEESFLWELRWDIEGRVAEGALNLAREATMTLVSEGIIGLSQKWPNSQGIKDFTHDEALQILELDAIWISPSGDVEMHYYFIYLTPDGESKWAHDDWGLSRERAQYLIFGTRPRNIARVQAS